MKATKILTMKVQRHHLCKGLAAGLCGRRSNVQSSKFRSPRNFLEAAAYSA
jgi:hypothetical protein